MSLPAGTHITTKGYVRYCPRLGGRMYHDVVWESQCGSIPEGYQIHHVDFNKLNNDLSNLQLVTPTEHKRIHSGCVLVGTTWWKPCRACGQFKPVDAEHWYFKGEWVMPYCRKCWIQQVVERKKARRRERKLALAA